MNHVVRIWRRLITSTKQVLPHSFSERLQLLVINLGNLLIQTILRFPARGVRVIVVVGSDIRARATLMTASILSETGDQVGLLSIDNHHYYNAHVACRDITPKTLWRLHRTIDAFRKQGCKSIVIETPERYLNRNYLYGIDIEGVLVATAERDFKNTIQLGRLLKKYPKVKAMRFSDSCTQHLQDYASEQSLTYGIEPEADCRLLRAKLGVRASRLQAKLDNYDFEAVVSHPGKLAAQAAMAAATLTYGLHVSLDHIRRGLESAPQLSGHYEFLDWGQDFNLVVHTDFGSATDVMQSLRDALKGRLISAVYAHHDGAPSEVRAHGADFASRSHVLTISGPRSEEIVQGARTVEYGVVVQEHPRFSDTLAKSLNYAKADDIVLVIVPENALPSERQQVAAYDKDQIISQLIGHLNT